MSVVCKFIIQICFVLSLRYFEVMSQNLLQIWMWCLWTSICLNIFVLLLELALLIVEWHKAAPGWIPARFHSPDFEHMAFFVIQRILLAAGSIDLYFIYHMDNSPVGYYNHDHDIIAMGVCHLATFVGTSILVLSYDVLKSLQLFWRSGTRRWNLRVPNLQLSCSDLTVRYGTRMVVPVLATRVTCPIDLSDHCCWRILWITWMIRWSEINPVWFQLTWRIMTSVGFVL